MTAALVLMMIYRLLHSMDAQQAEQFDREYRETLFPITFSETLRSLRDQGLEVIDVLDILLFSIGDGVFFFGDG